MYRKLNNALYHRIVSEIKQVDVILGCGCKDFGKGFYMAVSKGQAEYPIKAYDIEVLEGKKALYNFMKEFCIKRIAK